MIAGLLRWAERPHAGGRNAIGHGNLIPDYQGVTPTTKLLGDGENALGHTDQASLTRDLREHVQQNMEAIRQVLNAI